MNIVRVLTSLGDWGGWGTSTAAYISGNLQVAQNIQTRLYTILGECPFSTNSGLNLFVYLGYPSQTAPLNLAASSIILNTQDVLSLVSINTNVTTALRTFVFTYTVNTIYSNNFESTAEVTL
jgi:hypothetical protein